MSTWTVQRTWRWYLLAAAAVTIPFAPAAGQQTGQDVYQEQLRLKLDEQLPEAREIGFDAGGWFSFAFFNYDDAAGRRHRTLRQFQLRGWASFNMRAVHRAYVRGLLDWRDWNGGDNPSGEGREDDFNEFIERAWYQFDLGQLLKNQTGQAPPVGFRLKVGRQFATIGTALVLSMPLDMIQFNVEAGNWEFMALLAKTIRSSRNIDESFEVENHQKRCLWGLQATYTGFDRHEPFVYFLSNHDRTSPDPPNLFQSFKYSSRYLGLGSTGTLWLPNLQYRLELVGEWGRTYSAGVVSGRDSICAMAANAALAYYFRGRMKPKVMFEYIWGSGDRDRAVSSVATVGGNRNHTTDHAFNAFGFRDTGIAFSPRISNIHIYSLGATCRPLEDLDLFREMEVGTKVFFYHKSRAAGAISDTTAVNDDSWLGWEWDVFCNWRLTSDLAWTIRYGAFQPGSAYDGGDKTCRQFLYTGVVLSF